MTSALPKVGQWCWANITSALSPHIDSTSLRYFDHGSGSRIFAPRSEYVLCSVWVASSAAEMAFISSMYHSISAGASDPGAIRNS